MGRQTGGHVAFGRYNELFSVCRYDGGHYRDSFRHRLAFGGNYYTASPLSADKALVLTDVGLSRCGFDGSAFSAPNELLPFPAADAALNYGGTTFYYAALDKVSGYLYFTGYSQDLSKGAIYRVKLLQ